MLVRRLSAVLLLVALLALGAQARAGGETFSTYLPLVVRPMTMMQTHDIMVDTASFIGGSSDDEGLATAIAPDGTILWGGSLSDEPAANGGVTPTTLFGGGTAALLRLAPDGSSIVSVTRIGAVGGSTPTQAALRDLAVLPDGRIVACGSFGLVLLDAQAETVLDSIAATTITRCDAAADGSVAWINTAGNDTLSVVPPGGNWDAPPFFTAPAGEMLNDVVLDRWKVFLASERNPSGSLRIPRLRALDRATGALRWESYAFPSSEVAAFGLTADSSLHRLVLDQGGYLYVLGRTDGGNTIFNRNPYNLAVHANNTVIEGFTTTENCCGGGTFSWIGRFQINDGTLDRSQFHLTRLGGMLLNRGNTLQVLDLAVTSSGYLALVGSSNSDIFQRSIKTINGTPVGDYAGGDAMVMVLNPTWTRRSAWTVFNAPNSNGARFAAVTAQGDNLVFAGSVGSGRLITVAPFQPDPRGAREGFVVAWSLP